MSRDALVVGINIYECPSLRKLEAPAQDAEAIAQILEQNGEFSVTRLPAIKDKQNNAVRVGQKTPVTLNQLEEAIVQLFKPEGQNIPDTALLYFSGHGLRKTKGIQQGFLATSDVNPDQGNWGLSLQWLRQLLQESEVKQQIIWLDCCYSGELLNFHEADPGDRGKGRDRCFIAASREYEEAYEAVGVFHSVLTQTLLQGLKPKQHSEKWVTNYSLIDFLNKFWQTYPQRPLFANSGSLINLTRTWWPTETLPKPIQVSLCPYRGLQYFDFKEEDAKYFYGREALIDQLLDKVRTSNFLAVLGGSGSGKSSVVRAGLLYQLGLGRRLSGSEQWEIKIFRPGEHPLKSLALAFVDYGLTDIERASQLTQAEGLITTGCSGLKHLIEASNAPRIVLVVDQFEEVFTLCQNEAERKQFFECLLGNLQQLGNKICLVLVMRADFLGKCSDQEYSGLAQQIQQHLVTVTPMTREELEQAIVEPAQQVGLEVEPELVEEMIADVEGSPGSLPLLEYTLKELWQQHQFTLAAYTHLGGVKGTLQKRATEVYKALSSEEQPVAKRIFLELTQLGEGTEDTRRRVLLRDLVPSPQEAPVVERVIGKLADEKVRLLVTSTLIEKGTKSGSIAVVDVAHEALIRNWPLLRQWLNENREALRQKRKIEAAAQEWLDNGKIKDYLLQGVKLAQAEDFLQTHADTMPVSSPAKELIAASQAERDYHLQQEEERRQRELQQEIKARQAAQTTTKVALASTVLVSIAAIFAFFQWREAQQQFNIAELQKMNITATQSLNLDSQQLEALIDNLKAGKQLEKVKYLRKLNANTKIQVIANLRQALDEVKEKNRLVGHNDDVNDVAFSPDGQMLASASGDKTVKLWRTNGTLIHTFKGHDNLVKDVTFSPDGQLLASASGDKTVKLWRITDGSLINTLKGHQDYVNGLVFSPNGLTLASASDDNTVKLWRTNDGSLINTLKGHESYVWAVAFSPNGLTLASAGYDNTVKLWRTTDGNLINTLKGHENPVKDVAFSPDGQTLASGSDDNTVKLWRTTDGRLINTLKNEDEVYDVAFSPDGKIVASGGRYGITLWGNDGTWIATFAKLNNSIVGIEFDPTSKTLASAGYDNRVKLWRTDGSFITTFKGHEGEVSSVSFSPDGKNFIAAGGNKTAKLWRNDGTLITTLKGHESDVWAVAFSPDGQTIASGSNDNTVKLWKTNGSLITTLKGHENTVFGVAFSPDGQKLASASADTTIKLWRTDGSLITTLKGHEGKVWAVAFSPDGQTLASASADTTIKLWRTIDGSLITTIQGHENPVLDIAFSPDSKTLASASGDKTVKLWRTDDGSLVSTFQGHEDGVRSVTFSPDGQTVASGSWDNTVKLWSPDGSLVATLKGHKNLVYDVAFSPDGKTLASASKDNTVRMWDLQNVNDLDYLLNQGCNLLRGYLQNPNNGMKPNDPERRVCDDVR
ncbi:MAG TPA: caspase family protein [Nostocaceae cyanobacterium]|nr:caspase family protein [Nostocaceae cyanobacterium]